MATRKDAPQDPKVDDGDVIHASDDAPVADDPHRPVVPTPPPSAHLEDDRHNALAHGDPEVAERLERIAELEREVKEAERQERRRLIDADRQLMIDNLDEREAELRAQLARVRGDRIEEPQEENR